MCLYSKYEHYYMIDYKHMCVYLYSYVDVITNCITKLVIWNYLQLKNTS